MHACKATRDFDSAGARFRQAGENITYKTSTEAAGRRTSTIQKEVTLRNGTRHQDGSTTGKRQDNSTKRAQTSLAYIAAPLRTTCLVGVFPQAWGLTCLMLCMLTLRSSSGADKERVLSVAQSHESSRLARSAGS